MQKEANAGFSRGAAFDSGTKSTVPASQKASTALFGISMLLNSLTSAITAWKTAGVTHKNAEGEYVESSEAAQKQAGKTAAVLAMLPFGIGSLIDSAFGISEKIAARYDMEKDAAASAAKQSEKMISALNSMDNHLNNLENYEFGSDSFKEALNDILLNLYSDDQEETRKTLELYLGGAGELKNTIQKIQYGTEEEAKAALRQLKVAELEAKKQEITDKYATQSYNNNVNIADKFARVNNYEGENHFGEVAGGAVAGGAAGAATGATAGVVGALLASGGANAWNPVG